MSGHRARAGRIAKHFIVTSYFAPRVREEERRVPRGSGADSTAAAYANAHHVEMARSWRSRGVIDISTLALAGGDERSNSIPR